MEFYSSIADVYDRIFPFDEDLVSFMENFLARNKCNILDVGCATGFLANALARNGHEIVGIDLDPEMIRLAKKRFQNTRVSFQIGDMGHIDKIFEKETFDAVACFGNTLVHLQFSETIAFMLKKVYAILRPGGIFTGQIIHYDRILSEKSPGLSTIDRDNLHFERIYLYQENDPRIIFETILSDNLKENSIRNRIFLYPLQADELLTTLTAAGYTDIGFFSGTDLSPLRGASIALYFIGKKPP